MCKTLIPIDINILMAGIKFPCPTPDCPTVIDLSHDRVSDAIKIFEAMEDLKDPPS